MQIVMNDNLKEALEMTCKYANEYKVDIDVHFNADGEVSVSVTPTYRDRAEQTELQTERIKTLDYCDICNHKGCDNCIANNLDDYCVPSGYAPKDTPQTDCDNCWKQLHCRATGRKDWK